MTNSENNIFKQLNEEQKQAVIFGEGPVLLVAGAGTGKTTVLTQRIAYLIEKGKAEPEEILALTFTDKAAEEMEERTDKLLPIGYLDLWISTFHSFCERVLKEHGLDIGLPTDFRLLDETAAWLLVRRGIDKFALDYYRPLGNPSRFLRALLSHFSRCKDQTIFPEDYLNYAEELKTELTELPEAGEKERLKEISGAYHAYQRLLLEQSALDFGDLINYCLKLFRSRPAILEKYRRKFKYVLVDEFQDTNLAQYELIKMLAAPRNNLMAAADDDQSVYKFRGASCNNVLQFRKDYPQVKEISLLRNYRSSQNILDLTYRFIQANNPNRLEHLDKIDKKLRAERSDKGIIEHLHFSMLREEAQGVALKIAELLKRDSEAGFGDFAVLVRANDSANVFASALDGAGIPYYFFAARGLYSKPVILDIISYFRVLDNHYESSAVYRILNLPFLKIPTNDLIKINQYGYRKALPLYEVLQRLPLVAGVGQETTAKINFILSLLKKHSAGIGQKTVSEVFLDFLQDSGYLKELTAGDERQSLDLIAQFYEKIKEFEADSIGHNLKDFVEQLDMELTSGEQGRIKFNVEQGPDVVRLMTVHSAKGLEFKYVFLVNMVDKRFPAIERKEPIEIPGPLLKETAPEGDSHLEEERRLCYVAMTRAKKGLFLCSADDYGGARKKKLSRFLIEMGFDRADRKSEAKEGHREALVIRGKNGASKTKVRTGQGFAPSVLPGYFSFSQLAAFSKCPLQYKFAHILRVPVRGKAVFSFGKTMHNTLHEFMRSAAAQGGLEQQKLFGRQNYSSAPAVNENIIPAALSLEELLRLYQKNWIDDWYEDKKQKEEYCKLGRKALKAFYQDFLKRQPQIAVVNGEPALEQWFRLKTAGHTFQGRIDRIDRAGGGVEIIDYKTGSPKEKLSGEEKQQLLIYQIAAEEVFGLKPVKLTYYYVDEGRTISFLGSEKDKESQKRRIAGQIEQIRKSDFKATPGWQCGFCDFKDICERRA